MAKLADWPAAKVVRKKVADLAPYAQNARTHSDEQIDQICASIAKWGWTNPVLIDETEMILAGHGRVLAAERMGIKTVPAMVARGWADEDKRAYVLADNQLALNAGWDEALLASEVAASVAAGLDMSIAGFSEAQLADIAALVDPLADWPEHPDVAEKEFQQVAFKAHESQVPVIFEAIKRMKASGAEIASDKNTNSNTNALVAICEDYLAGAG